MFTDILIYQKILQMFFSYSDDCQMLKGENQVRMLMQTYPLRLLVVSTKPGKSFGNMF